MANLPDARVGKNCRIDPGVQLNAVPGRRLRALSPLRLGDAARVRSGTVLYAHTRIGRSFETGHHVVVREENRIGDQVSIWNHSTVDYGCRIGNRVKIHCSCYIAQFSVLEDDVFLAPGVVFANDLFPGAAHAQKVMQGPVLRKGAKIGVNSTILPGVVIGEGALVGAGSVVTRDVAPGAVVWGSPARARKQRSALRWPAASSSQRKEIREFYLRKLAGRPAFKIS